MSGIRFLYKKDAMQRGPADEALLTSRPEMESAPPEQTSLNQSQLRKSNDLYKFSSLSRLIKKSRHEGEARSTDSNRAETGSNEGAISSPTRLASRLNRIFSRPLKFSSVGSRSFASGASEAAPIERKEIKSGIPSKNIDWSNSLMIGEWEVKGDDDIDRMLALLCQLSENQTRFPSTRKGIAAENFPDVEAGPSVQTQSAFQAYDDWHAGKEPEALTKAFKETDLARKERHSEEPQLTRAKKLQIFGRICGAMNVAEGISLGRTDQGIAALEEAISIYRQEHPPYNPHSDNPRLILGSGENNALGLQSALKDACYALLDVIAQLKKSKGDPEVEQKLKVVREKLLDYTNLATDLIYTSHGLVQRDENAHRFEQGEIVFYEEGQSVGTMGVYGCVAADFHLEGGKKKAATHYDSYTSHVDSLKVIDERMPPGVINVRLVGAMFGPDHVDPGWREESELALKNLLKFLYQSKRRFHITSAAIHDPLQPQDIVFGPREEIKEAIATKPNPDMALANQWIFSNDSGSLKSLHLALDLTTDNDRPLNDKRLPRLFDPRLLESVDGLKIADKVWRDKHYEALYDFAKKHTRIDIRIPSNVGGYLAIIKCYRDAIDSLKNDVHQAIKDMNLHPSHKEINKVIEIIEAHPIYVGGDAAAVNIANQPMSNFIKNRLFHTHGLIDFKGLEAVKLHSHP